jgi:hypothetical protein
LVTSVGARDGTAIARPVLEILATPSRSNTVSGDLVHVSGSQRLQWTSYLQIHVGFQPQEKCSFLIIIQTTDGVKLIIGVE